MPISLDKLAQLSGEDLAEWVLPRKIPQQRADLMVEAAVEAVREAVRPRTEVPGTAKAIVLEAAARGSDPGVQQESLGSRSVSFFAPGDPRRGVFLTDDELAALGVYSLGVGVVWTRSPGGAVP